MKHLIDKDALVAEIESKIEKYTKRGEESDAKRDGYGMYWGGVLSCLNEVRTLCDTLEVKEMNLEEKATQLSQKYFPNEENIWARPNIEAQRCKSACIEMVEWLKAQKGENI